MRVTLDWVRLAELLLARGGLLFVAAPAGAVIEFSELGELFDGPK